MKKIGFDVSDLVTNRADGTTRYARELAKRLPTLTPQVAWQYFAPGPVALKERTSNVQQIVSPWSKYWTQLRLPANLYRYQPDVLFMPIQQIPYVRPGRMRTVAVIHDLAVHYYPEQFTYKDWLLLHVFSAYVAREADAVITVSQATARDVAQFYGRSEEVHVVYHGVDHAWWRPPHDSAEANDAAHLLKQRDMRLGQPYVLYVGQIQPRKNIERLVAAFEQIAAREAELTLVIAGGYGWRNHQIFARIAASRYRERIVVTGAVPDTVLRALYWQAQVFALPSLYEGFGMPVAEAMASGCPVVTARVSSLPEVAGSAAVLIDPMSAESIAAGINEARRRREELRQAGLERARTFSWERCAAETLAVLTQVA